MLSKAKLKSALKEQDLAATKQIIPSVKQFQILARNKGFYRLVAPAIKLLFSDNDYYKKVFSVNVMTTMYFFTHEVMKDFEYLKEKERKVVDEALIRPLLKDEKMFLESINNYFELKYFEESFASYKKELAEIVIRSPNLFWRVIQSFSNLQLFCEEHPEQARAAIILVLLSPVQMKNLLMTAIQEAIFAGYCLVHCLTEANTYKEVTAAVLTSARKVVDEQFALASKLTFFSGKAEAKGAESTLAPKTVK